MRMTVVRFGDRSPRTLRGMLLRFAVNAAGLSLAAALVPGIEVDDAGSLLAAAAVFALLNTFVRPFAFLASCCLIILTFGLFIVVINAAMLGLTAWISGQLDLSFHVDDFGSAVFGALIISFVSFLAYTVVRIWRLG